MKEAVGVFSSLASEGRLELLDQLAKSGPVAAKDLLVSFEGSQPHLSRQLKILLDAGLVRVEKAGTSRIYHLSEGTQALVESALKIMSPTLGT